MTDTPTPDIVLPPLPAGRETDGQSPADEHPVAEWYAIRTPKEARAEKELASVCEEILFPKETVKIPGKPTRTRALIPKVLFVKADATRLQQLERKGREHPESALPFWIYRYPKDNRIRVISSKSISLLRLLSSDDTAGCEIFNRQEFKENQHVRVTGGRFKGYEGSVVRVRRNKHVVVRIEGVCLVMLPFIHPDLLETVD